MKTLLTLIGCIVAFHSMGQMEQLDGAITTDEWENARIIEDGQNKIRVVEKGNLLWIRLKTESLYVANLCLCNTPREVTVLHASAALDAITYRSGDEGWTSTETFVWEMRETGMNETTRQKRQAYFEKNGWIANTGGMGNPGETEFIIDRLKFDGQLLMGVGLMTAADPENIVPLPKDSASDCAAFSLVSGNLEAFYEFKPEGWYKLY